MDVLEQCKKWNKKGEHQKIVDALEAIPGEDRTPEEDSELAQAYTNLADPKKSDDRELFKKIIALMEPHEKYFAWDHCWNFRMGYAYYYLDQAGPALWYFEKALKAQPNDKDTREFISRCKEGISLPQFSACFRERTKSAWERFAEREAELRGIMSRDKNPARVRELADKIQPILKAVFGHISFEMGVQGERNVLILIANGDKVKLFELIYFQKHAPKEVLEHWDIRVGGRPKNDIGFLTEDGLYISGDDVQIWLEEHGKNTFGITVYSEKMLPIFWKDEDRAFEILTNLCGQALGEIPFMRYVDNVDVVEVPKAEPSFPLTLLPDKLMENGVAPSFDPEVYLETSNDGYQIEPNEDPDADLRLDVVAGVTSCLPLISCYLNDDNYLMDNLHADGATAGFFCFPLDTLLAGEDSSKYFDFRNKLGEILSAGDGQEEFTLLGGATGLNYGYVDFIAWDIRAVLSRAKEFFEGTDIPWASFHTFYREASTVILKQSPKEAGSRTTGRIGRIGDIDYTSVHYGKR